MGKPQKTVADYMVIALSPVLIMALVGSLCFFLIEVFYRGKMLGGVCWVMFWFIIGIVLVSRIAIENSTEHAAMYGFGLALATWIYMMRTQPSPLLAILLLAIVWFCAHKLVWDCTLIDDDQDSSGQGLLQKTAAPSAPETKEDEESGEQTRQNARFPRRILRDDGWFIFHWRRYRCSAWGKCSCLQTQRVRGGVDLFFWRSIWRLGWDCWSRPVSWGCGDTCASVTSKCLRP